MATLTRTAVVKNAGINLGAADASMVAVAASDTVTNTDGKTLLIISNQNAGTDTVTIPVVNASQQSNAGDPLTAASVVVAIATTERRVLGPFSAAIYNDASGNLTIQHSVTATVKITCLQLL